MASSKYLHGYSKKEQNRLIEQSRFLESYVFEGVDLEFQKTLLEVGCGVGAQTKILCRRFPDLTIASVDRSPEQLAVAKKFLAPEIKQRRVRLYKQDAANMRFPQKFDAAFLCWFLEHVPDPVKVLRATRKQLRKGAKIYCTEVFNSTLFIDPYSPTCLKYWFEFNDYQWTIGGHPFIGAQLGNLLTEAGFKNVRTEVRPFHFDSREPEKRKAFIEDFFQVLLSAKDNLLADGRIDKPLLKKLTVEINKLKKDRNSVIFSAFIRATATT